MIHITTEGRDRAWVGANAPSRGESSRRLLCNLLPLQRGRALPGKPGGVRYV